MAKKIYDMVVKNGSYQAGGEEKARWINIGSIIQTENGTVALINRTFNPAGVVGQEDSETILASLMPADRERASAAPKAPAQSFDDPVPF